MGDFDKGFSKSMKLLGTLPLAALGQFYDYAADDSGRFGALQVVNAGTGSSFTENQGDGSVGGSRGHGGNKRYCHTTGHGELVYNWTSNTNGGYFAKGRNIVQCIGEELYCFIEERAQFGQIIGISAGCEQMMNHPSVTIQDQQTGSNINAVKNNYNQEAARGGVTFHGLNSFYGLGGCLLCPLKTDTRSLTTPHRTLEQTQPPGRPTSSTTTSATSTVDTARTSASASPRVAPPTLPVTCCPSVSPSAVLVALLSSLSPQVVLTTLLPPPTSATTLPMSMLPLLAVPMINLPRSCH